MRDQVALRVLSAAGGQVWAMREDYLRAMIEVASRDHGPALEALAAKQGAALENSARATIRDGVAIVPLAGPLFRYANLFTAISGATSLQTLSTDFGVALANKSVKAILLDVDSPGGEINGTAEMAQMVMAARAQKPVYAYVSHLAQSGAYWIASAASRVFVAPTAIVGSLGVVMTMRDTSAADAKSGVKTLEIVSSQSPDKRVDPSTTDGKAKILRVVDRLAQVFVGDVARQRGVSVDTVMAQFGKGASFVGADAVAAGMVDGVSSFEAVLAFLSAGKPITADPGRVASPIPRAAPAPAPRTENQTMTVSTLTPATAGQALAKQMSDAQDRGRPISITEAAARVRTGTAHLTPGEVAADAIAAEMKAAEASGQPISPAQAASRLRLRK